MHLLKTMGNMYNKTDNKILTKEKQLGTDQLVPFLFPTKDTMKNCRKTCKSEELGQDS